MTCPHCMNWSEEVRDAHREIEHMQGVIDKVALIRLDLESENRKLSAKNSKQKELIEGLYGTIELMRKGGTTTADDGQSLNGDVLLVHGVPGKPEDKMTDDQLKEMSEGVFPAPNGQENDDG